MNIPSPQEYRNIEDDPFCYGVCHISQWKRMKKKYKAHCYEILSPYKLGEYMRFSYISRLEYIDLIAEVFTQTEG